MMNSLQKERTCYGLYAVRAYVRGLAGRLSFNRTSRFLCKLRSIYPNRGFHGGTACKMVKGMFTASVAPVYCLIKPHFVF